jgi:hypothetical protein
MQPSNHGMAAARKRRPVRLSDRPVAAGEPAGPGPALRVSGAGPHAAAIGAATALHLPGGPGGRRLAPQAPAGPALRPLSRLPLPPHDACAGGGDKDNDDAGGAAAADVGIVVGESSTLLGVAAALNVTVRPLFAAVAGGPGDAREPGGCVYRAGSWDEIGLALWGE